MARFGQFMKDQLMPEDPMDWFLLILVLVITSGAFVVLFLMASSGYL